MREGLGEGASARAGHASRTAHDALIALAGLIGLVVIAASTNAGNQEFRPGQDGWVSLFDGSEVHRWKSSKGADWALKDGVLTGSTGEIHNGWHWVDFELISVCRGSGTMRCRVSFASRPDQPGYWLDITDGTLHTAKGRMVAQGRGKGTQDWREVRLIVSRGRFSAYFDGQKVAEGTDVEFPAMGMIGLAANGQRLELKSLRVRPLNREKHLNVPAPNSACYVCHANFEDESISAQHGAEDIGCAACHGASLAHRSDEENVTAPDVLYLRGEVDAACLRCHKRHEVHEKRKDSADAMRPTEPPPKNAVCTDCHGQHRVAN